MSVKINLGAWNSVFAVPSKIVDEGLKFSDGVKLKVLLFVLRNCDKELSDEVISKATGVNVTDIPEALDYWVNFGVLCKSGEEYNISQSNSENEASDAHNLYKELNSTPDNNSTKEISQTKPAQEPAQPQQPQHHFAVTRPQKPDYVFTAQRLAVDEELGILVNEAQSAFGKTLSNSDISTLLMLKDTCGLPLDVILMLIHYCISIGKGNMRTVEKIGVGWADDGVYSLEAADNKIKQIRQTSKNYSIVAAAFEIKNIGSPTRKQLEYSDKWVGEWKFSPEMLREAYERCVDAKGAMKFQYIDGILKRWYANNLHNTNDLQTFEKLGKKSNAPRQKSSYDIDELEKIDTLDNI
jgi:DnaD/phage-associated family protein